MCATCGCGDDAATITMPVPHPHPHPHEHPHDHHGGQPGGQPDHHHTETIPLEQQVLAKNDRIAGLNRARLTEANILALNITSSPGAGKTTLLERTISALSAHRTIAVIEGDQETLLDAERIRAAGARAVQVNTGAGCHLDAQMIDSALNTLAPEPDSLLFIENVGNLVCPALFDLGEDSMVVVISVTEGADKPLKYPHMFAAAGLIVVNKVDLLPYVDFDLDVFGRAVRAVNHDADVLLLSAATGEGLAAWYDWIGSGRGRSIDKANPSE